MSMKEAEALAKLEAMPEKEFKEFYDQLPYRVRLCCEGGLVDWREALPQWYLNNKGSKHEPTNIVDSSGRQDAGCQPRSN